MMRINTACTIAHPPIEAKTISEKKAASYEENPVSAGSSASSIGSRNNTYSEGTLIERAELDHLEYEVVEGAVDLFSFPEPTNEEASKIAFDLNGINVLFDTELDIHAHDILRDTLSDAFKRFEKCNKAVHTSWAKNQFLSADESTALKAEMEQASKLLIALHQICKDVHHIKNEIDWITEPVLTALSGETENQEMVLLPEEFTTILLEQVHDSISVHVLNIWVVQDLIEKHLEQTERFLALDENTPPKPGLLERASFILTAIPGLLGGLGTVIAYVLGAKSVLAFLPLAAGGIGSCIVLLYLVLNLSKFAPTEKITQLTEERIELNKNVFRPVLDLLKKAKKMNSGGSGRIPDVANKPATFAAMYQFNKPIQDNTAAILEGNAELQTSLGELIGEVKKNNLELQDLKRSVAPFLRERKTSTTSLNSNSSNDSQATTLVGSTSSSHPNTPPNPEQAKKIEELEEIIKRQDQKISGLETTLTHVNKGQEETNNLLRQLLAQKTKAVTQDI
ncbi:hypothetical protein KMZ15_05230 [Mycoavidus sp. HKI]|uniref:hypothetical protein n=1 Tax=Mycoavidus sp. HKI TaxID=2840467 RepID=UPI001CBEAB4E|nr:hypothetical protein [Mycoavidus sp. HKI]UAW63502.1 hypothetical protein KMZ15_05230 [Mycoavidus sp. HKI]